MRYRNTKTGAVIDVNSVISGGDWQVIPAAAESSTKKAAPKKKQVKKNG